jgi:cell division protein FtsB
VRSLRPLAVALALVVAAAAYAWWDADAGVGTWLRLRHDVAAAQARVRAVEARNEELRAESQALRSDPFAEERAVREELRWARPGEVVVRVPTGPDDGAPGSGALP